MKNLLLVAVVGLSAMLGGCAYPVGTTWGSEDNYNQAINCTGDAYIGDYVLPKTRFKQLRVSWDKKYLIASGGQTLRGAIALEKVHNLQCKDSYD